MCLLGAQLGLEHVPHLLLFCLSSPLPWPFSWGDSWTESRVDGHGHDCGCGGWHRGVGELGPAGMRWMWLPLWSPSHFLPLDRFVLRIHQRSCWQVDTGARKGQGLASGQKVTAPAPARFCTPCRCFRGGLSTTRSPGALCHTAFCLSCLPSKQIHCQPQVMVLFSVSQPGMLISCDSRWPGVSGVAGTGTQEHKGSHDADMAGRGTRQDSRAKGFPVEVALSPGAVASGLLAVRDRKVIPVDARTCWCKSLKLWVLGPAS